MSAEHPNDEWETPTNSKNARLSLKRKSCPGNLERKTARSDLGTPLNATFTSCGRKHRLSESQRAQLQKRRLEFLTANTENAENNETTSTKHEVKDPSTLSKEELIALIRKAEDELAARVTHERKVQELKQSIETWKTGFNEALVDLQKQLQAKDNKPSSKRTILQQLHVSFNVLKYIEDPDD